MEVLPLRENIRCNASNQNKQEHLYNLVFIHFAKYNNRTEQGITCSTFVSIARLRLESTYPI